VLGYSGCGRGGGSGDGLAYQGAGENVGDTDIYVAADDWSAVAREVDSLVLGASAGDLAPGVGAVLHHDGHDLVQMAGVVGALDLALACVEDSQALDLYLFRDGVFHVDGGGVRTTRILEAINRVVAYFFEQCDGVFEVAIGLARKADDDVGGQRDVTLGRLGPGNALEVPVAGVFTLHGLEYGGAAGLDGEMDVVAEGRNGVDDVDDIAGEIAGMRGGKADALDAVDLTDRGEKLREGAFAGWIPVAIDVLAEELDFCEARLSDSLGFGEDRGAGAAALFAARVGDDAVGAELIAAFDDRDVAAVGVGAGGELGIEGLIGLAVVEAGDAALAGFKAGKHVGEVAVGGGAGDDRDVGGAVEDLRAFLLGYAADDGEALPFSVEFLVLIEAMKDFLLGLVADGASVVKDEAGVGFVGGLGVALVQERAYNFFGVVSIHLTAKGFDVKSLHSQSPV